MTEKSGLRWTVTPDQIGKRLDVVLTDVVPENFPSRELTRAQISQWIADGRVCIDRLVCTKAGTKLKNGQRLSIEAPAARALTLRPQDDIPLAVVFEDADLLVLDKQAGISVHPGAGQTDGTLVNALLHKLGPDLSPIGDALRPGIVHRLDKDTSGLLVVAKTEPAFHALQRQLKAPKTMGRKYLALTYAVPRTAAAGAKRGATEGVIDAPIGRHPTQRVKMAIAKSGGREARTYWKVREELKHGFMLELTLDTGRTHQIRVHLDHCRAGVVGDPVYGSPPVALDPKLRKAVEVFHRQALHAYQLDFLHPRTQKLSSFESELPQDFQSLVSAFRGGK